MQKQLTSYLKFLWEKIIAYGKIKQKIINCHSF